MDVGLDGVQSPGLHFGSSQQESAIADFKSGVLFQLLNRSAKGLELLHRSEADDRHGQLRSTLLPVHSCTGRSTVQSISFIDSAFLNHCNPSHMRQEWEGSSRKLHTDRLFE